MQDGVSFSQSSSVSSSQLQAKDAKLDATLANAVQATANEEIDDLLTEGADSTGYVKFKDQREEEALRNRAQACRKEEAKEAGMHYMIMPVEDAMNLAQEKEQENPDLKKESLMSIRSRIKEDMTPEDILKLVGQYFGKEPMLMDEALDFLISTFGGPIKAKLIEAKNLLLEQKGREVQIGRNIREDAVAFFKKGGKSPLELNHIYRDITTTPRTAQQLYQELMTKYPKFEDLEKLSEFLFRAVGSDLTFRNSSMEKPQLTTLLKEIANVKATLFAFRFFQDRMNLVEKEFKKYDTPMPPTLTYQNMAKQFLNFLTDPYPSAIKARRVTEAFGLQNAPLAATVVLQTMRDAIHDVSPEFYDNKAKRKFDAQTVLISAVKDLDDQISETARNAQLKKQMTQNHPPSPPPSNPTRTGAGG